LEIKGELERRVLYQQHKERVAQRKVSIRVFQLPCYTIGLEPNLLLTVSNHMKARKEKERIAKLRRQGISESEIDTASEDGGNISRTDEQNPTDDEDEDESSGSGSGDSDDETNTRTESAQDSRTTETPKQNPKSDVEKTPYHENSPKAYSNRLDDEN
jgi:hypothetical protein